jgi:hypothetical protein
MVLQKLVDGYVESAERFKTPRHELRRKANFAMERRRKGHDNGFRTRMFESSLRAGLADLLKKEFTLLII